VHYTNRETYQIQPRDPNSAAGIQKWTKSYARGDWQAEVQTQVAVQALADVWRVEASLKAFDKDGIVAERKWREDVPRDLV
jgi:hypothetical protein